jgi:O-antigen ligase
LAWISIVWSSFSDLNLDKLLRYILFTMPAFFIGSTLGRQPERVARFIRLVIGISMLLLSYYSYYRFVLGINLTSDKLADYYANNYLEYSWHASYLFIILCVYMVFAARPRFILSFFGAVLSLAGLFLIGGRGPMLFGLMAVPLVLMTAFLRRAASVPHTKRFTIYVAGVALVGIAGYYAALASGGSLFGQDLLTVQRWELSLSGESTFSMDSREEAQRAALSFWQEKPFFGWGIGEFRVKHWLKYPHNLLVEVLMELGIVGALIFILLCAMVVRKCLRVMAWPSAPWQSVAIATLLLCSLASHLTVQGYLADDRAFLALMGLAASLAARPMAGQVGSAATPASLATPVWHRPRGAFMRQAPP